MTPEDLEKSARYIASRYPTEDTEELFQTAYLEGLEAVSKGRDNPYGYMLMVVLDKIAFGDSPVEIPRSGSNRTALAKMRRGEQPETASERRIASVMGAREDVLPITLITEDTPESLLIEREIKQTLRRFLEYQEYYLTEKQREAIGVRFFGHPLPEDFMQKYGVGRDSIRWHSEEALKKMRKVLK